jgi:hypothetical protein
VADTFVKVRAPGSSKSSPYQQDHEALSGLQELAGKLGIGALVSHHDRKSDAEDVFDTVSGTLGLTGAVDTIAVLTKKQNEGTTLHIRGRDLEEDTSLAMSFDRATCQWSVLGGASEIRRSAERKAVLEALEKAPNNTLTVSQIMKETGKDRRAIDMILFKMVKDGEIQNVSRGKYSLFPKGE